MDGDENPMTATAGTLITIGQHLQPVACCKIVGIGNLLPNLYVGIALLQIAADQM
jgi:hypothetical protein